MNTTADWTRTAHANLETYRIAAGEAGIGVALIDTGVAVIAETSIPCAGRAVWAVHPTTNYELTGDDTSWTVATVTLEDGDPIDIISLPGDADVATVVATVRTVAGRILGVNA